jgi:hypothetical protein
LDFEAIKRVLAAVEREDVRYVVFGAAALNLHGLSLMRMTPDASSPVPIHRRDGETSLAKAWRPEPLSSNLRAGMP